jgi:acyl-CoA reductase-like NAD-dependent aldehyde dehydrogenase
MSSRSLLDDVFTSISLKRALEKAPDSGPPTHPYVVGRSAVAGESDVAAAVEAAAAAVPEWSRRPLAERLRFGPMFRERLLEHWDPFVGLLVAEAHPRRVAEWELSCLLEVFSDQNCDWYHQQMYAERRDGPRRMIVRRQPDGVVCVNPPQNAPAPSAGFALLALMAGNTMVVRAPRSVPLSTMYLVHELAAPALRELGAPPGTLNVICGGPRQILDQWLTNDLVDDIFYFGDSERGIRLQQECVQRGKKPVLELAGNDGLVVWRDADLRRAAQAITECFVGSGQICMVPNYVLAHPAVADELLDWVRDLAARIRPGYPEDDGVLLAPVRRSERFFSLLEHSVNKGATLVCGGRRLHVDGSPSDDGVFLEPTVVRVDGLAGARDLPIVRHESFFPLLPVIIPEPSDDEPLLDAFFQFINTNDYGLRNSLWTRSRAVTDRFVREIHNGGLLKVNDSHIGFLPYLPTHGGTGLTSGVFGEANYPMLRTSHLQGVSIANGVDPGVAAFEIPNSCRAVPATDETPSTRSD